MYAKHFGLRCHPFEDRADTQFVFATEDFEEALAAMEYEARYGKGMALIAGEAGTGKTILIRALLRRLEPTEQAVVLTWPASGNMDLIRETAKGFGVSLPSAQHQGRCLDRLRRHLTRSSRAGRRSIVLIDQAEHLTEENLAQLVTLSDLECDGERLLHLILVSQPHIRALLNRPQFSRIAQQCFGEHVLKPLSFEEVQRYVVHRLRIAGAGDGPIFDVDALELVHRMSNGIPRLIHNICDAALFAAYGAGEKRVSAEIVAEVSGANVRNADQEAVASQPSAVPALVDVGAYDSIAAPDSGSNTVYDDADAYFGADAPVRDWPDGSGDGAGWSNGAVVSAVDAEAVALRLEAALARAERITATTEAHLSQFVAVERHLTSLAARAERTAGRIEEGERRATESTHQALGKLQRLLGDAQSRAGTLDSFAAGATRLFEEAQSQSERVDIACRNADVVESRLRAFTEKLADRADDVQERITVLMSGLDAERSANERLEQLIHWVPSVTTDAEGSLKGLQELLDQTRSDAERFRTEITESIVNRCSEKLDEERSRLEKSHQAVLARTRESLDAASARADDITERVEAAVSRIQTALDETNERIERTCSADIETAYSTYRREWQKKFDDHLGGQSKAIDASLIVHRARLQTLMNGAEGRLGSLEQSLVSLQSATETAVGDSESRTVALRTELGGLGERHASLSTAVGELESSLAGVERDREALSNAVQDIDADIAALMERANGTELKLKGTVGRAESALDDVKHATGEVEANRRALSGSLEEVGAACERIDGARKQIDRGVEVTRELREQEGSARKATIELDRAAEAAGPLIANLEKALADGAERHERLAQSAGKSEQVRKELNQAFEQSARIQKTLAEKAHAAAEQNESADQRIGRLTEANAVAEERGRELAENTESARQLHEALQGLVAHTDEKITRLDSHHASAANVLRSLNAANVAGRDVIEKSESTVTALGQRIDQATGRASQQIARLEEIAGRAEQRATSADKATERLESQARDCHELLNSIREARSPAEETAERLVSCARESSEQLLVLEDRCAEAGAIVDQLANLNESLGEARDADASIRVAVDEASALHARLVETVDDARAGGEELAGQASAAQATAEIQRTLQREIEQAGQNLSTQRIAVEKCVETSRPLLEDFIAQSRRHQESLQELRHQVETVCRSIDDAMERPTEIVAVAQAHAAQLEHVCSAVKKVFAELSRVALQARTNTKECSQASGEAGQRVAQVAAETDRIAVVLREWVAEANRAQARLESTLAECPSVRETHPLPADPSRFRLSAAAERIANASAAGALEVLGAPDTEKPGKKSAPNESMDRGRSAPTGKAHSRAEQIAQLIADAKRGAGAQPIAKV